MYPYLFRLYRTWLPTCLSDHAVVSSDLDIAAVSAVLALTHLVGVVHLGVAVLLIRSGAVVVVVLTQASWRLPVDFVRFWHGSRSRSFGGVHGSRWAW